MLSPLVTVKVPQLNGVLRVGVPIGLLWLAHQASVLAHYCWLMTSALLREGPIVALSGGEFLFHDVPQPTGHAHALIGCGLAGFLCCRFSEDYLEFRRVLRAARE